MKKAILLVLILVVVHLNGSAQLFEVFGVGVGYVYVGPKLGGNSAFNSVDVGTGITKSSNFGYQIGGVGKFGITEKLAIQTELVYTSKGFSANQESFDMSSKNNFNYFGLPVIAKYAFASISGVQVYGSGGFYMDVLTGVNSVTKFGGEDGEKYKYEDLSGFKRVDFGFSVGTGANFKVSHTDLLNVDLRFAFGVTDVDDVNTSSSSKNTTIQLSAVYLVDLTKWVHFRGSDEEPDAYD